VPASVGVGIVALGWAVSGHLLALKADPQIEVVPVCTAKEFTAEHILP